MSAAQFLRTKGWLRRAPLFVIWSLIIGSCGYEPEVPRDIRDFNGEWKFALGDDTAAKNSGYNDQTWRSLNLPHDWSIEGRFDSLAPAGVGGGALPGGIGWYRKTFTVPAAAKDKKVFIDFDGVYQLSEVWINGHYLGKRPNGYISFRYDLTPYLHFGSAKNVIAVRVDNADQPNSRWYSGSGIYRNVWLTITSGIHVDLWGTYVTTPSVSDDSATVSLEIRIRNENTDPEIVTVKTILYDSASAEVASAQTQIELKANETVEVLQQAFLRNPIRWTLENPHQYRAVTHLLSGSKLLDEYITPFGVRSFRFDAEKGFFLNEKHVRLQGVCQHHDLGALGAAVNRRAIQRQLEILKSMGCNALRTSHNPPAPELLDLCDEMGFIVMDEAFDMWKRPKNKYDYHLYWDEWHHRDLIDQILRDRNHPSVFMWSVGNEIPEQSAYVWDRETNTVSAHRDTSGKTIVRELVKIVQGLDPTRPITVAHDHTDTSNQILQTGVLDIISFNYRHLQWQHAQSRWGKKPFLATESASGLASRGHYHMPSDSIRRWPPLVGSFTGGAADHTCSSYDNCSPWWGSTHEESLKEFLRLDWMAGLFVWTGFDYLGEPTPYLWPSRSSYFGIIDLAGFPKDAYYLYQSVWTDKQVLHLLPHWNWNKGDTVDVWAYFNKADQVELFLNERSLGTIFPDSHDLHVMWRVIYEPGTLKVISRSKGRIVATDVVKTAGPPAKIDLTVDRNVISADGKDLSFATVKIVDAEGIPVPDADHLVKFGLSGEGFIAGVDNGSQTSMEPFKANERKAFSGMCLVIIQSNGKEGTIDFTAGAEGLESATVKIYTK